MTESAPDTGPGELQCSAKGCRADAVWALRWNNPKIHTPDRRKVWLACDEHRASLSAFLDRRDFLRDVVPVAERDSPAPEAPEPAPEPDAGPAENA